MPHTSAPPSGVLGVAGAERWSPRPHLESPGREQCLSLLLLLPQQQQQQWQQAWSCSVTRRTSADTCTFGVLVGALVIYVEQKNQV